MNLSKNKRYVEAHKVQQLCNQLEKDEFDKWQERRKKKMENMMKLLESKHKNELEALRKRILAGQDEQRKARSLELERLTLKFLI